MINIRKKKDVIAEMNEHTECAYSMMDSIAKMTAIDFDDSGKDYLDMSVFQHAKNRLPWLVILMIAYVFTGMIITSFESTLSQVISLVAYMPMLMGTGGNTGYVTGIPPPRAVRSANGQTEKEVNPSWNALIPS